MVVITLPGEILERDASIATRSSLLFPDKMAGKNIIEHRSGGNTDAGSGKPSHSHGKTKMSAGNVDDRSEGTDKAELDISFCLICA